MKWLCGIWRRVCAGVFVAWNNVSLTERWKALQKEHEEQLDDQRERHKKWIANIQSQHVRDLVEIHSAQVFRDLLVQLRIPLTGHIADVQICEQGRHGPCRNVNLIFNRDGQEVAFHVVAIEMGTNEQTDNRD